MRLIFLLTILSFGLAVWIYFQRIPYWWRSFRFRLLIVIASVSLVPLLVLSLLANQLLTQQFFRFNSQTILQQLNLIEHEMGERLEHYHTDLSVMSQDRLLQQAILSASASSSAEAQLATQQLITNWQTRLQLNPEYLSLILADQDLLPLIRVTRYPDQVVTANLPSDWQAGQLLDDQLLFFPIQFELINQQLMPVIYLAKPISYSQKHNYWLIAQLSLTHFQQELDNFDNPAQQLYLLDSQGYIIYPPQTQTSQLLEMNFPLDQIRQTATGWVKTDSNFFVYQRWQPAADKGYFWNIVSRIKPQFWQNWFQYQLRIIVSALIVLLVLLLLSLPLAGTWLLLPLQTLKNAWSDLASQPDKSRPVPRTYSQDEIDQLIAEFNQIHQQLRQQITELQHEVRNQKQRLQRKIAQEERTTKAIGLILERARRTNQELQARETQLRITNQTLTEQYKELQRQKRALKKANQQLQKLDQLKSDFLSNTSHELRTPLTSIKMYVQMLAQEDLGKLNPKQKQAAQEILQSTNHLIEIVNDLLDLKKLEANRMQFHFQPTDIEQVLSDVHTNLKGWLHESQTELQIEIKQQLPPLNLDHTRMVQLIQNLVSNAIKFNRNHNPIKIIVTKGRKNRKLMAKIQVIDQGIGIKQADQDKLFDKFYQVDSSTTRKIEGTGLGLAISKQIAEAHGGQIEVTSVWQKGTTFTIWLPLPAKGKSTG